MRARMGGIERRAAALPERPRLACIEWIEPLMSASNWMPELVAMAGGINLFGEAGRHSPWMDFGALEAADPDIILIMPCGFDIPRAQAEMGALTSRPAWRDLRAVREGQVVIADGNQYFNRPGPRLVDSLEILAEILHPETFRFGHEGTGWVRT
jgi:iron complex transport system substrate-binding protein